MLIAILICSAVACCLATAAIILIVMGNNQAIEDRKVLRKLLDSMISQISDSHRAVLNKVADAHRDIKDAIPPLSAISENVRQSEDRMRKHVEDVVTDKVGALEASNKKVVEHMSAYSSVIESQERLIEAVEHYAFQQGKNRRHG